MRRKRTSSVESIEGLAIVPDTLPEGWATAALRQGLLTDVQPGFASGINSRGGEGDVHLRPMNVNTDGLIDLSDIKFVPHDIADAKDKWIESGHVLFNNTNSPELVGKTAHYDQLSRMAYSNHMTRIETRADALHPKYLALALHTNWRAGDFRERCNQHISQASIGRDALLDTVIPVPPLAEQERIAEKVDSLLGELRSIRDRLRRVPPLLRQFREAIVSSVAQGPQAGPAGPEEAAAVPVSEASLEELCEPNRVITYGVIKLGRPVPDGVPCLRTSNVRWLRVDTTGLKRIGKRLSSEYSRTILRGGEVLVAVRGSLGGVAVVTPEMKGWNVSREVAVVPIDPSRADPDYVAFWIGSTPIQNWLAERTKGAAYVGINIADLRTMSVALPSLLEQRKIVGRIKSFLAIAERLEHRCDATHNHVERAVPAVLAKAFRGELVPQESSLALDERRAFESGAELLQRVADSPRLPRKRTVVPKIAGDSASQGEAGVKKLNEVTNSHLRDILRKRARSMTPEQLLVASELDVDDFYTQLKREVQQKLVRELRKGPNTVLLETVR